VREKYCWLVADKPREQCCYSLALELASIWLSLPPAATAFRDTEAAAAANERIAQTVKHAIRIQE
jgi:hypothetical protein